MLSRLIKRWDKTPPVGLAQDTQQPLNLRFLFSNLHVTFDRFVFDEVTILNVVYMSLTTYGYGHCLWIRAISPRDRGPPVPGAHDLLVGARPNVIVCETAAGRAALLEGRLSRCS